MPGHRPVGRRIRRDAGDARSGRPDQTSRSVRLGRGGPHRGRLTQDIREGRGGIRRRTRRRARPAGAASGSPRRIRMIYMILPAIIADSV